MRLFTVVVLIAAVAFVSGCATSKKKPQTVSKETQTEAVKSQPVSEKAYIK
ncbi:MAG: hypothetical protein WBD24_00750 [Candidatus Omnitrophota bacterium]